MAKRMTARYPGTCHKCEKRFETGTRIDFTKGAPAGRKTAHAECEEMDAWARAGATGEYDEPYDVACPVTGEPVPSAYGHGPGCFGECDGEWDCSAPA